MTSRDGKEAAAYHEEDAEDGGEDELPPGHLVHRLITLLQHQAIDG